MAAQTFGAIKSFKAAADYSAKQFYIVYVSAKGIVTLATGATVFLAGTLQNKPKANENAEVLLRSGGATGKVKLGGSVNIGDHITSDSNGKGVATTSGGDEVLGRALEGGVDGDIIEYAPSNEKYRTS